MPSSSSMFLIHNGVLRSPEVAGVALNDGIIQSGRGAFETIAAYYGRPFQVSPHYARLEKAAHRLALACPSESEVLTAMNELLTANHLEQAPKARLRLTLCAPADGQISYWIEATPPPPHPASARVITGPFVRNERSLLAGLKTIQYGDNIVAQRIARESGADEAIFQNTRGELCEGAWSNLFVLLDGQWITPPLSSGCLPGVTRELVIRLFRDQGIDVAESTLLTDALKRVKSAFLTSSLREIQAIAAIDARPLESAPEIATLQRAYQALTLSHV